jgi:hypothetical protein
MRLDNFKVTLQGQGSSNDDDPLAVYQKNMDASRKEGATQRNVAWCDMGDPQIPKITPRRAPIQTGREALV